MKITIDYYEGCEDTFITGFVVDDGLGQKMAFQLVDFDNFDVDAFYSEGTTYDAALGPITTLVFEKPIIDGRAEYDEDEVWDFFSHARAIKNKIHINGRHPFICHVMLDSKPPKKHARAQILIEPKKENWYMVFGVELQ